LVGLAPQHLHWVLQVFHNISTKVLLKVGQPLSFVIFTLLLCCTISAEWQGFKGKSAEYFKTPDLLSCPSITF
jgi:hypothetical protein